MMKFMKRSLSLLISAMLLLGCFALAEEAPLLPIAIVIATFICNLFLDVNIMLLVLIDGIIGLIFMRARKYN